MDRRRSGRVVAVGGSRRPSALASLIEDGAEVHHIDDAPVDVRWLGSHTQCDLASGDELERAIARIGPVIHAVHLFVALREDVRSVLLDAARACAIDDGFVVVDEFTRFDP